MSLAQFQSSDRDFQLMQNSWAAQLNPLLKNPANNSLILKNVSLVTGVNTINTRLGRALQGWKIVRQRAQANLWDSQDTNQTPELTLILNTTANVVVDLEIF